MSADPSVYAGYLESLAVLGDLPDVRRAAEVEAEQLGKDALNAALRREQEQRAQQRDLQERLRRLRGPVNQLANTTGAERATPMDSVPPDMTWEHLVRGVETLTRDLSAAERDAQWLQRNRTYTPPAPSAPPPAPAVLSPQEAAPATVPPPGQPDGRLTLTPLGWTAVALFVVLAVVAALLLF